MAKKPQVVSWTKIKAEYLQGVTPKDLAMKYNLTPKQVSDRATKKHWVDEKEQICANMRNNIEEQITEGAKESINYLREVVSNEEEKTQDRIAAAKGLLSVSGLEKSEKKITGNVGLEKVFITPDETKETDNHIDDFINEK